MLLIKIAKQKKKFKYQSYIKHFFNNLDSTVFNTNTGTWLYGNKTNIIKRIYWEAHLAYNKNLLPVWAEKNKSKCKKAAIKNQKEKQKKEKKIIEIFFLIIYLKYVIHCQLNYLLKIKRKNQIFKFKTLIAN